MEKNLSQRIWQIDAIRGTALLGMILYHIAFGLFFFASVPVPIFHWSWELLQTTVASTFLLLVGVSLTLKYERLTSKNIYGIALFRKFLRSAGVIFAAGMLITFATWLTLPEFYVRFGVLHLIGVGSVLAFPVLGKPKIAAVFGTFFLLLPWFVLSPLPQGNIFTLWLGFPSPHFQSLDYFPVIPWFGLIALGTALGTRIRFPPSPNHLPWLSWMGRHSLTIYLIHQPLILLGILLLRPWL